MPLPRRQRGRLVLFALAATGALTAAAGWVVTDRLERDDDFCNACHLPSGRPLHIEVRRDFDARPPASLAAAHARAELDGERPGDFRCIDCHGGTGVLGRVRVKALAARDAFWYAVGHFEEPDGMRWPLWDRDCRRCHASFASARAARAGASAFHALPVHNVRLGVACVECHVAHEPGGNPDAYFVHADLVRSECARCHSEFEEGSP